MMTEAGAPEVFEEKDEDWEYAGLEAIDRVCSDLYPDQPNPLQTSAVIKFWLGGPDPLDYIRMYSNPGDTDLGIPAHWHYVTLGFSDLHGDGRVHEYSGSDKPSGYGFELTLRLKKGDSEVTPPSWPSALLQSLSRYVFQTGNILNTGDHVPWHRPLDGGNSSIIQHILLAQDLQLKTITTPYGTIEFRQVVGVTEEEMKAAQKWKGTGVIDLMTRNKQIGPFLLTDIQREISIFENDPSMRSRVTDGINQDGSNLGHVTGLCRWLDINAKFQCSEDIPHVETDRGQKCLEGAHVFLDLEAALLLPVIVRARLQKGRFFVFHSADSFAIHLVPSNYTEMEGDVFVSEEEPIKVDDTYLQIYCNSKLQEKMSEEFQSLEDPNIESQTFPLEFQFSSPSFLVTVSPRGQLTGLDTVSS